MQMPYAYDTCHIPYFIKAPDVSDEKLQNLHSQTLQWCKESKSDCQTGSYWTQIYEMNAVCLMFCGTNFIFMVFGSYYFYPRLVGSLLNFILSGWHYLAVLVMLTRRFDAFGKLCRANIAPSTYTAEGEWSDATTYRSDGDLLFALATV